MKKHVHREVERCALSLLYEEAGRRRAQATGKRAALPSYTRKGDSIYYLLRVLKEIEKNLSDGGDIIHNYHQHPISPN
jgi:hypothetical protein